MQTETVKKSSMTVRQLLDNLGIKGEFVTISVGGVEFNSLETPVSVQTRGA